MKFNYRIAYPERVSLQSLVHRTVAMAARVSRVVGETIDGAALAAGFIPEPKYAVDDLVVFRHPETEQLGVLHATWRGYSLSRHTWLYAGNILWTQDNGGDARTPRMYCRVLDIPEHELLLR